jgi:CDK-activating kinase assembly factor MAT1
VERIFAHGTAPCPVCQTLLRRSDFLLPTFTDLRVERECRIRRRLTDIFNRREEDFETVRDYNDYLEEVEGIVWCLVEEVDVQKTNERLEAYRLQNLEGIQARRRRGEEDAERERQQRWEEEQHRMEYEDGLLAELEAETLDRRVQEQQLIEELARSSESAVSVIRKTVGREAKRRAQMAALQEMPSMRGLKIHGKTMAEIPSIDPFETVPELERPDALNRYTAQFESWYFGTRIPDVHILKAGGVVPSQIAHQILLSITTFT